MEKMNRFQDQACSLEMPSRRIVWPQCTQGRTFSPGVLGPNKVNNRFMTWDEIIKKSSTVTTVTYKTFLPPELKDTRIIGQPVCIGCHGNIFIFQYFYLLTNQKKTIKSFRLNFLFIDADKEVSHCFTDHQYLQPSTLKNEPLYCLISPGLHFVLFRLPYNVLKANKWASVQISQIHKDGDTYTIDDMVNAHISYRDRRTQEVIFHPKYENRVVIITPDYYATSANIQIFEHEIYEGVLKKNPLNAIEEHSIRLIDDRNLGILECASQLMEAQPDVIQRENRTQRLTSTFSKSGNFLIVSMQVLLTERTYHHEKTLRQLHTFFIDSENYTLAKWHKINLESPLSPQNGFICTQNDSNLEIYLTDSSSSQIRSTLSVKLPVRISLMESCRASILKQVHPTDVPNLNLPTKLVRYLQFDDGLCSHCQDQAKSHRLITFSELIKSQSEA
ncbi:unnamed protein product [Owenia fusiformis]|uniref:Uncharacterized protein n=1 Tax=Owenia fusiformis TaxID=6347 RepID=A0A8J1XGP9_OWEFU|nr:unnamed protein product [Owenia fusiformis]